MLFAKTVDDMTYYPTDDLMAATEVHKYSITDRLVVAREWSTRNDQRVLENEGRLKQLEIDRIGVTDLLRVAESVTRRTADLLALVRTLYSFPLSCYGRMISEILF